MRGYREIGKTEQIIRIISLCHSKCRVSSHLLGDANAEHFVLLFPIKLIIPVGVRVLTTYTQKKYQSLFLYKHRSLYSVPLVQIAALQSGDKHLFKFKETFLLLFIVLFS